MTRRCKTCGTRYEPSRPIQTACSVACALIQATQARIKKEAKADKAKRESLKSRAKWMRETQRVFNLFIRTRDADEPCISCGRTDVEWTTGGQWDCGHYLSVGSHPELRFDERNAAKQCKSCNGGSGKYAKKNHTVIQSYRIALISKIGLSAVEELEGPHEPKHYTIDDLKAIKVEYAKKLREINGNQ